MVHCNVTTMNKSVKIGLYSAKNKVCAHGCGEPRGENFPDPLWLDKGDLIVTLGVVH